MDKPIEGDRYIRTLSHYLRTNQRRLQPASQPANGTKENGSVNSNIRSLVTPADPLAAAYSGMVNSLWNVGSAVVNSITPSSPSSSGHPPPPPSSQYQGSWDGTGTIDPNASPSERLLSLQAQLRAPILPLDLYYLLYLLDRFDQDGIEIEGWDGLTPRTVGDSNPRVLRSTPSSPNATSANNNNNNGKAGDTSNGYSSFPPPASPRPQSIRSFSSTALSTLTLITGWKQWSTAASSQQGTITIEDDIRFIHDFIEMIPSLRLMARIDTASTAKGRIVGFETDTVLHLFQTAAAIAQAPWTEPAPTSSVLLPMASLFKSLSHLEIHKIPVNCIEGWETLMGQLRSLVVVQASIEDVHQVLVEAVVRCERRRRQRVYREQNRAQLMKEERQAALREAELASQGHDTTTIGKQGGDEGEQVGGGGSGLGAHHTAQSSTSSTSMVVSSSPKMTLPFGAETPDSEITQALKMWPQLRHFSAQDNALPALAHSETFSFAVNIVSLDLSHNLLISPPLGLIHLFNLHTLNLSYNMLTHVQQIYQILGNIAVLDLRGNRLESLCGLERLWNLEKVDVRENHLDEAAEVGRLAALPGIREVWSESNPFCKIQPKHRLEILAVFKANGHDLLLDGSFASFTEKRALANLGPTAFSTTISSINNPANIPAASAPSAVLAKDLSPAPRPLSSAFLSGVNNTSSLKPPAKDGLEATTPPGTTPNSPVAKLEKKKLVKSSKRVKRVVNLDSDHEEGGEEGDQPEQDTVSGAGGAVLGPAVMIAGKNGSGKNGKSVSMSAATAAGEEGEKKEKKKTKGTKKKVTKKKKQQQAGEAGENNNSNDSSEAKTSNNDTNPRTSVHFGDTHRGHDGEQDDTVDHSLCHDGHHVHRLAQLEQSMASLATGGGGGGGAGGGGSRPAHHRQPSRSILKRSSMIVPGTSGGPSSGGSSALSPRLRPSSPIGSFSSDDGADEYRRRIEAMRMEAGTNWLKVLAEMDRDVSIREEQQRLSQQQQQQQSHHHQPHQRQQPLPPQRRHSKAL
ncbi:hypothetical protein DFQ26_003689 [Actinomortierella ambigua]|nr:hypothetical protein DFQ26_003689 [Actinomortierella ambigua]